MFAASGVIFAAVYLLWMYQSVVFGEVKNPKLNSVNRYECKGNICYGSNFIFIVWIGIYPSTFLKVSAKSVNKVIEQVFTPQNASLK